MAKTVGLALNTVQQIWKTNRLQPHRLRTFKRSTDPALAEKVADIVGLYMHPPAHAVVLSIDEKSQIQALDRTQPSLPIKPGKCGTMTHDYKRHGTTTLFAALNTLEGVVHDRCMQRHTHQEFTRFLNTVERAVPAGKLVHAVLDNYEAPQSESLARPPPALGVPLHPDLRILVQRGGKLLLQGVACSARSPTSRPPSTATSRHTTMTPSRLCGANRPISSSPNFDQLTVRSILRNHPENPRVDLADKTNGQGRGNDDSGRDNGCSNTADGYGVFELRAMQRIMELIPAVSPGAPLAAQFPCEARLSSSTHTRHRRCSPVVAARAFSPRPHNLRSAFSRLSRKGEAGLYPAHFLNSGQHSRAASS